MICVACQTDNKESSKACRKCGVDLQTAPLWRPDWKWHVRLLCGIYLILTVAYFAISSFLGRLPAPYRLRDIPKEITPWMQKG